ncbi:MAG: glycosyltransferase family 2 protein [Rhodoferax sp.]|nr:glycosyltransferase family 2 protein [Rhodoferax sp.]
MKLNIGVVVPCYNEEEVLPETHRQLRQMLDQLCEAGLCGPQSSITFVDDGSRDGTWPLIESIAAVDPAVRGIKLSRNRGHQVALLAGLFAAAGDVLISIDADMQDDVSAIEKMIRKHNEGADIVYGVRDSRDADTAFKRWSATTYYRLLARLGVDLVFNHADYRLMSRRAVEGLKQYEEVNLFLRGIVPLIGYKTATVFYDRAARFAGVSKYPFKKMLAFAIDGITSFSVVPLRLITLMGFVVSTFSFAMVVAAIYSRLVLDITVPGWASSVVPIYFLGGIQLLSIGVLGEYVGKLYMEAKRRPRFFIEATV